jgi:6-pyruvoyltetrahydropterin/6-carboxytetrahydropterin synthase
MYRVERRFTLPIGHRLSKHGGRCKSIHGHNFVVLVGVKSVKLNPNDMVIDFSDLKAIVNGYLDTLDHCLLLNECDPMGEVVESVKEFIRMKRVPYEPTAEKLAEEIYNITEGGLKQLCKDDNVKMDYVIVYENENSKATYTKDL